MTEVWCVCVLPFCEWRWERMLSVGELFERELQAESHDERRSASSMRLLPEGELHQRVVSLPPRARSYVSLL